MVEMWDLYNIKKNRTGHMYARGSRDLIPEGMYHLVVEIWVKNARNKILLTQRHPNKNNGLLWECSKGAVVAGEDSITGAIRELGEEVGIHVAKEQLIYLGETVGNKCIIDTYLCELDEEVPILKLQKEEVVSAKFITKEELYQMKDVMVEGTRRRYCRFEEMI